MTEQTTPEQTPSEQTKRTAKKTGGWVAIGIFTAGAILLIDDKVKKVRARKDKPEPEKQD